MIKTKENQKSSILVNGLLFLISITCVIPFALLIVSSFTDETVLLRDGYSFFPSGLSLDAYKYLWNSKDSILRSYGITIITTTVGTIASLVITTTLAYSLSRKDFPARKILMSIVVFTILFNGGLVPTYIMYTSYLRIKNTLFALMVPRLLMTGFNVLIMRAYFIENIPMELLECARIDGASEFTTFKSIVIPIAKPILATIGLLNGMAYCLLAYYGIAELGTYISCKKTV